MARKLGLTILIGIILTVLIISVVNVGMQLIYERPEYGDYCGEYRPMPVLQNPNETACAQDVKICEDGTTVSRNPKLGCEFPPCSDEFETCQKEYDSASDNYNQIRFYVFAIIGFALLLLGLWHKELLIQITGLATGGILVLQGVVMNLKEKLIVFITLLLILAIFGVLGYRLIKNSK